MTARDLGVGLLVVSFGVCGCTSVSRGPRTEEGQAGKLGGDAVDEWAGDVGDEELPALARAGKTDEAPPVRAAEPEGDIDVIDEEADLDEAEEVAEEEADDEDVEDEEPADEEAVEDAEEEPAEVDDAGEEEEDAGEVEEGEEEDEEEEEGM